MSYYQQGYGGGPPQGPPPPQAGYAGQYAPPQGQYPPQQGQYQTQQGHYPPQQGQYPPQQGQYPPNPSYPPQHGGGYPPQNQPTPGNQSYYQQPQQGYQNYQAPPYGVPPPSQYGQPQGQYAPPTGSPYPPPGGAPYGAPPQQQYGPPNPPSLGYDPNVRAISSSDVDADAIRKAMKGFGTDEKTLIRVLTRQDPIMAVQLKETFNRKFGRDLEKDIKSETSGWFEAGLLALCRGPLLNDVYSLYEAIHGPGTNEELLNDALLSKSNADLRAIKHEYQTKFKRSLDGDVKGELSMKTERHFAMVLAASRNENSAPVIPQEIDRDVLELYKATEGKVGTDELLVCSIISSRSDPQLTAIAQAYEQKFRVKLEHVIKREFSGHMQSALLQQLKGAVNRPLRDAELLEAVMAGVGTKDKLLVERLVRYHWDRNYMNAVKSAYQQRFHKDLGSRVKGETSGHYEQMCLALLNG